MVLLIQEGGHSLKKRKKLQSTFAYGLFFAQWDKLQIYLSIKYHRTKIQDVSPRGNFYKAQSAGCQNNPIGVTFQI